MRFAFAFRLGFRGARARRSSFSSRATNSDERNGRPVRTRKSNDDEGGGHQGKMMTPSGKPYDLDERAAQFGEAIIDFAKKVPVTPITKRLIEQLVGAGTSVGANYREADDAVSKKDFRHKISISKREAREAKFFLRMTVRAVPELRDAAKPLWQEAKELHLIFAKIYRS